MKNLAMLMMVLAMVATTANATPVPWFTGTSNGSTNGNPYTDGSGGNWTVYQIDDNAGISSYTNLSLYQKMTWNTDKWEGFDLGWTQPTYNSDKILIAAGTGSGTWRQAAIGYDPALAGSYSWEGSLGYRDLNPNNVTKISTDIEFGKFNSTGTWTSLYAVTMADNTTLNLGTISALQNISVGAGEQLVLAIQTGWTGYWAAGGFYFNQDVNAPVGIVPEPVTVALLGFGSLCLLRKKK